MSSRVQFRPVVARSAVSEDLYRIGAVAKRTGISPECLRAWERRYGLEPAERAGKTRFYDLSQIERLTCIKALLDQGHPISQVIHLPVEALERRLAPRQELHAAHAPSPPKVALAGAPLVRAYREADEKQFEAAGEWAGVAELLRDALPSGLDCVVLYLPSLDLNQAGQVAEFCPQARIVVTYRYATAADLAACRAAGHPMLRWPAEWRRVEALVLKETSGLAVARRYSDEELLHISLAAGSAGQDSAAHLATLVGELNDYAAHVRRRGSDGQDGRTGIEADVDTARAHLERALAGQVELHGLLATAN